jgi:hypothetical protein
VRTLAKSWQEVKKELEEETDKIFLTCPDEIKRFHYGIMFHSDAGKHSFNQYFGHWVHAYDAYMGFQSSVATLLQLTRDPDFDLKHLKKLFNIMIAEMAPMFAEYAGQKLVANYIKETADTLDTVQTKEEFAELIGVFGTFVTRLYWWFHWYFPWGVGASLCPRLSAEDIKEIARLGQIS